MSEFDHDWLADQFEAHRGHLRGVAYRMLGSTSEADDAVQEAWLRLSRSGGGGVENLGGWLTTVVGRIALDMLRSRTSRREDPFPDESPITPGPPLEEDPEQAAITADAVGLALLVVLETLTPSERVAFVLHDLFAVPFDEIAPIVGRSPAAARQLASRARRRVQGAGDGKNGNGTADLEQAQRQRQRRHEIVEAFLAASRRGDFAALLAALDPNVVMRADEAAREIGAAAEVAGAAKVAEMFSGGAKVARLALIDGVPGLVWMQGKTPRVVFDIAVSDGLITGITLRAEADYLRRCEVELLHRRRGVME